MPDRAISPWCAIRAWIGAAAIAGAVAGTGLLTQSCGDTCFIISTGAATEWTVTFALADGARVRALEATVVSNNCNGSCDCNPNCDCNAHWNGDGQRLDCEAVVDAELSGRGDGREARFGLVFAEEVSGPAEVLRCSYHSAVEPVPSDFRVTTGDPQDDVEAGVASERATAVVVTAISPR